MLGTVLDRITKLFGRAFFISAFFPVVLFVAINTAVAAQYLGWTAAESWWSNAFENKALAGLLLLLAVTSTAYLTMIVGPMLKRFLEGSYAPGRLGRWMKERKIRQFIRAEKSLQDTLADLNQRRSQQDEIRQQLIQAFQTRRLGESPSTPAATTARIARLDEEIDKQWGTAVDDFKALTGSVEELAKLYKSDAPTAQVEGLHRKLHQVLEDAVRASERRYAETLTELNSRFDREMGKAGVRATALGNVMNAIWSYPFSRYGIDPVTTWPPLQTVIPKEYYPTVEDARISYDFAVVCTYLSAIISMLWLVVMGKAWLAQGLTTPSWPPLAPSLAVAGGIVGVLAFRALAIEAARSFGAVFRTCFDLFRFELLEKLSLPLPTNLTDERKLWERVNQLLVYGDWSQELNYAHEGKTGKPAAASPKAVSAVAKGGESPKKPEASSARSWIQRLLGGGKAR